MFEGIWENTAYCIFNINNESEHFLKAANGQDLFLPLAFHARQGAGAFILSLQR